MVDGADDDTILSSQLEVYHSDDSHPVLCLSPDFVFWFYNEPPDTQLAARIELCGSLDVEF